MAGFGIIPMKEVNDLVGLCGILSFYSEADAERKCRAIKGEGLLKDLPARNC